jgi:MYXO-CTERM domain-containing protein
MCEGGVCGPPGSGGSGGTGGSSSGSGGIILVGGTTGFGGSSGSGGSGASSGNGDGDDDSLGSTPTTDPGCACRTTGTRDASWLASLVALAAAGAFRVRRRQRV